MVRATQLLTWLAGVASAVNAAAIEIAPESLVDRGLSLSLDASLTFGQCHPVIRHQDFWMETIKHTGISPFLNDSSYAVYRNVKDFGAKGDGKTDDTAAIQAAIDAGGRCLWGCGPGDPPAKTLKPALIYFPSGTYKISQTLNSYIFTQLVGNPLDRPVLKADKNFSGRYLLDTFPSPTTSPFPTTINLYYQVRNFVFDTTSVDVKSSVACVNWPSAQAVTLSFNHMKMAENSLHQGVVFNGTTGGGGGSATFMGDLEFTGGNIGIRLNNQQYAMRALTFNNVKTGIQIDHIFTLSLQGVKFNNVNTGVNFTAPPNNSVGSVILIDSEATSTDKVVVSQHTKNADGSLIIENLKINRVGHVVADTQGASLLSGSTRSTTVKSYIQGTVYKDQTTGKYLESSGSLSRPQALVDSSGAYWTKSRPQYEQYSSGCFSSVRDFGATGDGKTDATKAINAALKANANRRITYFPAGNYRVSGTIHVPVGSRIVGEVWSTISAYGKTFEDEKNPQVVFKMGDTGSRGIIEVSDIAFDVADVLPGAILVENNASGFKPGDVGLWDAHFRAGGTIGSEVETKCRSYPQSPIEQCKAAFLFMHLKSNSQTYLESVWGWSVNRDLDGLSGATNGTSQSVAVGRGLLVESKRGTWLVGTAFEHFVLYQYQFVGAENVQALMAQTETVYWQPAPVAPQPWTPDARYSDPDYSNCDGSSLQCFMGWSLRVVGGSDLTFYGLGFWQFFNGLNGVSGPYAQDNIVSIEGQPKRLKIFNLGTHLVKNMVTVNGNTAALSADNKGGWGGLIAAYLPFA
ncbi:pectate lyase superfamily protein domain-containing protein [Trichoderma breve]|uniref:Pectate lyase superfamily protein domain-containing protein n=1 Tax=Trichoderma breve TaxID=2034170 RepID=A0A9W9ECB3_9HYPO|nr:pectate lyase superfamily protein domain-containing protein [Trichoderma breve]KAJ4864051.1 pectate lyase superfamily protein domain-containing protein [Trichoderma breve]